MTAPEMLPIKYQQHPLRSFNLMKKANTSVVFLLAVFVILFTGIQFSHAQIPFSTQPEKTETRSGNKEYKTENFSEAEANYKKALDIKNNMPEATFNLGDAVYQQKRYDDAVKQFQLSAQTNPDPAVKAKAYHNLGNTYLEQKKWEEAVKAYKSALKINPNDADTKYNLAYANAMLQKNKGGGGQDNKNQDQKDQKQKDQKDKQQQNQDKQDQKDQKDQKDQNKDQKQDQKQDQQQQANNQEQKDKQQQGQKSKLSKEESDKLLAALENEEQKTTQKVQQKKMKAVRVKIKKDW